MRFCYSDPPYVGQAQRHYQREEVDHAELIARMERDYDGWALSASSPSLRYVLSLCPSTVRIAVWVKPFAIFKPNVNPAYAWEPVLFRPSPRKRSRKEPTVRDWVSANITLKRGLVGVKPEAFCFWIFELLGIQWSEDTLDDLFPGSGAVTKAWEKWKEQKALEPRVD